MARPNKPWYRADRDVWVVKIKGKQVVLSRGRAGKQEAVKAFYKLMVDGADGRVVTVGRVVEFYVSHSRAKGLSAETQEIHRKFLAPFSARHGGRDACTVTPVDVRSWVDEHEGWSRATRFMATRCIKRAWRVAHKEKLIPANNMADMENPMPPPCSANLTEDDVSRVLAAIISPEFRDLFTFIFETGCRQGEARSIEARDVSVDGHVATLARHKTAHAGKSRRIYMSEKAREIVSRLSALRPSGPIFLNSRGGPWNRPSICMHMKNVRERAGLGGNMVAKSLRSHWITDALASGVPIATVAELAGHANTRMIEQVYSRLSQRHDYLVQSVESIRKVSADDHKH